jgi:hypothetical protein
MHTRITGVPRRLVRDADVPAGRAQAVSITVQWVSVARRKTLTSQEQLLLTAMNDRHKQDHRCIMCGSIALEGLARHTADDCRHVVHCDVVTDDCSALDAFIRSRSRKGDSRAMQWTADWTCSICAFSVTASKRQHMDQECRF